VNCLKCGANSKATDYCDQCGSRLGAKSGAKAPKAATPASPADPPMVPSAAQLPSAGTCSNCGSPRAVGELFCEVCGFDYQTGQLPSAPKPLVSAPRTHAIGNESTPQRAWDLVVSVDPVGWAEFAHLRSDHNPAPASTSVALITGTVIVGRASRSQNIRADVDLRELTHDPAVSARHARLDLRDGRWELVDLGSDNGTMCNDVSVSETTPIRVESGSVLRIGAWTVCTLTAR
jgi:FHA domain